MYIYIYLFIYYVLHTHIYIYINISVCVMITDSQTKKGDRMGNGITSRGLTPQESMA